MRDAGGTRLRALWWRRNGMRMGAQGRVAVWEGIGCAYRSVSQSLSNRRKGRCSTESWQLALPEPRARTRLYSVVCCMSVASVH